MAYYAAKYALCECAFSATADALARPYLPFPANEIFSNAN